LHVLTSIFCISSFIPNTFLLGSVILFIIFRSQKLIVFLLWSIMPQKYLIFGDNHNTAISAIFVHKKKQFFKDPLFHIKPLQCTYLAAFFDFSIFVFIRMFATKYQIKPNLTIFALEFSVITCFAALKNTHIHLD
jgi:hypothetical protein